jgi:hypothetical protein
MRSAKDIQDAIKRAELDGQAAAAEHLRIILNTRNKVAFDQ